MVVGHCCNPLTNYKHYTVVLKIYFSENDRLLATFTIETGKFYSGSKLEPRSPVLRAVQSFTCSQSGFCSLDHVLSMNESQSLM